MRRTRTLRWRSWDGAGLEQLTVAGDDTGHEAEGVVIGDRDGPPYALHYRLRIDAAWRVREVALRLVGGGRDLHLTADGEGRWQDGTGRALPELAGCIDVDIAATPFTNTLPIRRLRLAEGEAATIRVAYVAVPALTVEPADQRYTRRAADRFLYEGLFRNFEAELAVDGDGLVLDYPGLFRRVS